MTRLPKNQVLVGDALARLRALPNGCADSVITSPPYFGLRNYDVPGQLGAEPTVDDWVANLRQVLGEVARVISPQGTLWLNLGDSFSRGQRYGAPTKSLLLGPERLLLTLAADGWTVRNKVVWAKRNPKPSSVRDRLTATWEPVYLLTRSRHYYFDLDSVRVPHRSTVKADPSMLLRWTRPGWLGPLAGDNRGLAGLHAAGRVGHQLGKNPGDVWTVASSNYRGTHFATFPEALIEPCLLAGCPARVCTHCQQAWRRTPVSRRLGHLAVVGKLVPACDCHAKARPGLVLDPFLGAGTVAVVAERLSRDWLGVEINPAFARLADQRVAAARLKRGKAA